MDFFLDRVSQQAVTFAIRSGITVTSSYAIRKLSRYISSTKGKEKQELLSLQERLGTKIRIISPAIDLVEIISARGNTSLESALTLTKTIRNDIQSLGVRLSNLSNQDGGRGRNRTDEISAVTKEIKNLLSKIEDAVPFINLAITTSGVEISSNLPQNVSPSRLLQSSTLLTAGDTAYALNPFDPAQIGTTFTLSLYMLFAGHSHRQEHVSAKDLTWQEVIYKCKVKLQRVPLFYDDEEHDTNQMRAQNKVEEYCYELCLIEDLEDGRAHDEEELQPPMSYEDVSHAGLRTRIPIHQISKLFYTNSGTLLGIEDSHSPILLIKRDLNAGPPRRLAERYENYHRGFRHRDNNYDIDTNDDDDESDGGSPCALDMGEGKGLWDSESEVPVLPVEYALPRHLDPEWLAFEVFTEPCEDEDDPEVDTCSENGSQDEFPLNSTSSATFSPNNNALTPVACEVGIDKGSPYPSAAYNSKSIKSSLSILECLLRLTLLQNYQQTSHLAVHDELLNLFLSDSAWSGSRESRQMERENAQRRIGFDPFGSPKKQKHLLEQKETQAKIIRAMDSLAPKNLPTHQENQRGTQTQVLRPASLEARPPTTPKKLQTSGAHVLAPEPWTPEQQLSSMYENTSLSSPIDSERSPPDRDY